MSGDERGSTGQRSNKGPAILSKLWRGVDSYYYIYICLVVSAFLSMVSISVLYLTGHWQWSIFYPWLELPFKVFLMAYTPHLLSTILIVYALIKYLKGDWKASKIEPDKIVDNK